MPDKKKRRLTTQCSICNGPSATHLHYGAVACYSCRAFFRRGIGKPYCCVEGTGDCSIDLTNRRSCQWCRFDRCLKAGMKPELVDASFRRKTFNKKHNASFEEPVLIDNFRPLEKDDISDFLQDIAGASSQPLMSGDSLQSVEAGGNIYFLESEADLFNLSYVAGHEEEEEESEDEEEDVRNSFDIETLVDECFMNETSRRGVIVQS